MGRWRQEPGKLARRDPYAGFLFRCYSCPQSVHPHEFLWYDRENDTPSSGKSRAKVGKHGDWAFKGPECTVLFECKAMQPTLELRHFGSQPSIDELRRKIVCGLEQVIHQGQSMQQGGWSDEGLPPAPFVSVLISYGQFYAVRLPWFRERIQKALDEKGLGGHPFAVLSINEFDTIVRLTELGYPMDKFFLEASQEPGPAGLLKSLSPTFAGKIVASSYAHRRDQDFESRFLPTSSPSSFGRAGDEPRIHKPAISRRHGRNPTRRSGNGGTH